MQTTIEVSLPVPHDEQERFLRSAAKRRVIVAGRRGGKTTGVSMYAVEKFLEGRRVLYAAPTQDQTDVFWTNVKSFLSAGVAAGIIYQNETRRLLEIFGFGRIRAKTAWDADSLRGDFADVLILEEYQSMNPSTWEVVGAPMLLDNDGDAIFIGTPMRKNHFFRLYARALGDTSGRWAAFRFTSHKNPYLRPEALAEITSDMSEEAFRQEILAEFLEDEGSVFRNLDAACSAPAGDPKNHSGHRMVAGVDWGKQADYTAVSIGCATCKVETAVDRFNKIDYSFQIGRIEQLFKRWNVSRALGESNSMGEPVLEQAIRRGIPISGFLTTATSKPPLIEDLSLSIERVEWRFLSDPIWRAELESYERKVSPTTGRASYSAPAGMHDDTVIARALMKRAAGSPVILFGA